MRIKIKPLSVNQCWQGRRFKTKIYKAYEQELLLKLKPYDIDETLKLAVYITWGFSSKGSDIDNPTKPFFDILQKKYGFNDSRIYELHIKKEIVKKGSEFIDFEIETITPF